MQYTTNVNWVRRTANFNTKTFDRTHQIKFGGGFSIEASTAPEFLGRAELPNPEELFTSALSTCFMLTFLYWAATKGLMINEYRAEAIGTLSTNEQGKMAMTRVVIKPTIEFQGEEQPDPALLDELFKKAHENCFIANSVKTVVTVELQQPEEE